MLPVIQSVICSEHSRPTRELTLSDVQAAASLALCILVGANGGIALDEDGGTITQNPSAIFLAQ